MKTQTTKTALDTTTQGAEWVRSRGATSPLAKVAIAAAGAMLVALTVLLLLGNPGVAEAADKATLSAGQKIAIKADNCRLEVPVAKTTKVRVQCVPGGIEGGADAVAQADEAVSAPTMKKTLSEGDVVKVLANNCELDVTKNTQDKVIVKCTAIVVPTVAPTVAPTTAPSNATVYVQNYTGGTLCYEIYDTGIGEKCSSGDEWLYGTFPAGTYTWAVSANCGTDSGSFYYGPQDWYHWFECTSAAALGKARPAAAPHVR